MLNHVKIEHNIGMRVITCIQYAEWDVHVERAFFDTASARIKQTFNNEIDTNLPKWARRTNPIVRRDLGSYWKTLTPDMGLVLRIYLIQVGLIILSFPFPLLFVLLMPTVTVTLVLLPIGLVVYGQILYRIGTAAAASVVKEHRNGTRDLLLIIPHSARETLLSKIAASIWRQTENLSLVIVGTALASLPLLIIQYDMFLSVNDNPILMRFGLTFALGMSILRVMIEPVMVGALGVLIGAAIPSRISAMVTTIIITAAYFLLINLVRFAPIDEVGRLVVEIVFPILFPVIITYFSVRVATTLLTRD